MRLVLVGGGTAGHIFPTIAVARQLATLTGAAADLTAVCGSRELDRLLYRDVDLEVLSLPARGIVGVAWWQLPWRLGCSFGRSCPFGATSASGAQTQ